MPNNGNALLTALSTFAITNIDDLFVLVAFFAEAAAGSSLTPTTIVAGQYVGFTVVLAISMIGFELLVALPTEPIGFLGLLPILLGLWSLIGLFIQDEREEDDDDNEGKAEIGVGCAGWKAIIKVALVTLVNSGDNIGTYIPLFAQATKSDLAIYAVTYYVLLGGWCFVAWAVMQQGCVLSLAEKYAGWVVPNLYVGLGVWVVVRSGCYSWLESWIDDETDLKGFVVLAEATVGILGLCTGAMVGVRMRQRGGGKGMVYREVAGEEDDVDMSV